MNRSNEQSGYATLAELLLVVGLVGGLAATASLMTSFLAGSAKKMQAKFDASSGGTQAVEAVVQRIMLAPSMVSAAGVKIPFEISADSQTIRYASSQYPGEIETIGLRDYKVVYTVAGNETVLASGAKSLSFTQDTGPEGGGMVRLKTHLALEGTPPIKTAVTPRSQSTAAAVIN